jgi:hypothetical protein
MALRLGNCVVQRNYAGNQGTRGHVMDHEDQGLIQDCTKDYIAWNVSHVDRSFVLNSNSILILVTAQHFSSYHRDINPDLTTPYLRPPNRRYEAFFYH